MSSELSREQLLEYIKKQKLKLKKLETEVTLLKESQPSTAQAVSASSTTASSVDDALSSFWSSGLSSVTSMLAAATLDPPDSYDEAPRQSKSKPDEVERLTKELASVKASFREQLEEKAREIFVLTKNLSMAQKGFDVQLREKSMEIECHREVIEALRAQIGSSPIISKKDDGVSPAVDMEVQVRDLRSQIEKLNEDIKLKVGEIEAGKQKVQKFNTVLKAKLKDIELKDREIASLAEKSKASQLVMQELTIALDASKAEQAAETQRRIELEMQIRALQSKIGFNVGQHQEREGEDSSVLLKANEELKVRLENKEDEVANKIEEIDSLQTRIAALIAQEGDQNAAIMRVSDELQKAKAECQEHLGKLHEVEETSKQTEASSKSVAVEIESLRSTIADAHNLAAESSGRADKYMAELHDLRDVLTSYKSDLAVATNTIAEITAAREELSLELEAAQSSLETLKGHDSKKDDVLQNMNAQIANLQQQLEEAISNSKPAVSVNDGVIPNKIKAANEELVSKLSDSVPATQIHTTQSATSAVAGAGAAGGSVGGKKKGKKGKGSGNNASKDPVKDSLSPLTLPVPVAALASTVEVRPATTGNDFDTKSRILELQVELETLRDVKDREIASLSEKSKSSQLVMQELTIALDASKAEQAAETQRRIELEKRASQAEELCKTLEREHLALEANLEKTSASLVKTKKDQSDDSHTSASMLRELEAALAKERDLHTACALQKSKAEEENLSLVARIEELRQSFEETRALAASLQHGGEEKATLLSQQLDTVCTRLTESQSLQEGLQVELKRLELECMSARNASESNEKKLVEANQELQGSKSRCSELQLELEVVVNLKEELSREKKDTMLQIEALEKQLQEATSALAVKKRDFESISVEASVAAKEKEHERNLLATTKAELDEARGSAAKALADNKSIRDALEELKRTAKDAIEEAALAREERERQRRRVLELEGALELVEADKKVCDGLEVEVTSLRGHLTEANVEIEAVKEKLKRTLHELEESKSAVEAATIALELAQSSSENDEKLEFLQASLSDVEARLAVVIAEKDALERKNEAERTDSETRIEALSEKAKRLKLLLAKSNNLAKEREAELERVQQSGARPKRFGLQCRVAVPLAPTSIQGLGAVGSDNLSFQSESQQQQLWCLIFEDSAPRSASAASKHAVSSGSAGGLRWVEEAIARQWEAEGASVIGAWPDVLQDTWRREISAMRTTLQGDLEVARKDAEETAQLFAAYKQRAQAALKRMGQEDRSERLRAVQEEAAQLDQLHEEVADLKNKLSVNEKSLFDSEQALRLKEQEVEEMGVKLSRMEDKLVAERDKSSETARSLELYLSQVATQQHAHEELGVKGTSDSRNASLDSFVVEESGPGSAVVIENAISSDSTDKFSVDLRRGRDTDVEGSTAAIATLPAESSFTPEKTSNNWEEEGSSASQDQVASSPPSPHSETQAALVSPSADFSFLSSTSAQDLDDRDKLFNKGPGKMLLYKQAEQELLAGLAALRAENASQSVQIRDGQRALALSNEQIAVLKDSLRELEAALLREREFNASSGRVNVEYLVNVLRKFLLSDASSERSKLAVALCTILHINADETKAISDKWAVKPVGGGLVGWFLPGRGQPSQNRAVGGGLAGAGVGAHSMSERVAATDENSSQS